MSVYKTGITVKKKSCFHQSCLTNLLKINDSAIKKTYSFYTLTDESQLFMMLVKKTELQQFGVPVSSNSCHGTEISVYFQRFCGNKINRKVCFLSIRRYIGKFCDNTGNNV